MNTRLAGYLLVIAALLLAALSTGARLYYAPALTMIALLLIALVSALWTLWTLKVSVRGVTKDTIRGGKLDIAVHVKHMCPLPTGQIRVTIASSSTGKRAQELMISAAPFKKCTYRYVIACPHRGIFEAGVVGITVTDLFGLFAFTRREKGGTVEVKVRPKILSLQDVMEIRPDDNGPESVLRAQDDTASPSDVRAWQDGDEMKRIHWKLSARRRELTVRVYEASGKPDMLIVPDLTEIPGLPDQILTDEDAIIEQTISMAKAQLGHGHTVRIPLVNAAPSEAVMTLPQETDTLAERFIGLKFDSPYPYEQVLLQMNNRLGRTGGLALITAKLTVREADLAIQFHAAGLSVRVIWITDTLRTDQAQLKARMEMAGVTVSCVDPYQAY